MYTKVNQYNKIFRWEIKSNTKKNTTDKLLELLDNSLQNRVFVINIIKELINFKIFRQQNNTINQEEHLCHIIKLCEDNSSFNVTAEELMKLVKNQSYFYQVLLPTTFKKFLKSIKLTETEITLFKDQQSFLTKNSIKFNKSPEQLKYILYKSNSDSIGSTRTHYNINYDTYQFNIWNIVNAIDSYKNFPNKIDISGFIFTPNMFFYNHKKLQELFNKKIPIIIIYNENQSTDPIIKYFLDCKYPLIQQKNIEDIDPQKLLEIIYQKDILDKSLKILSEWLNMLENNFVNNNNLNNSYKKFKNTKDNNLNNSYKKFKNTQQNNDGEAIKIFKQYAEEYNKNKKNKPIDITQINEQNISSIYRKLALYFHPDKQQNGQLNGDCQIKSKFSQIMINLNNAKFLLI
jgi:hypothetical protein